MSKTINILMIEDSESDACMLQHTLADDPAGRPFGVTVARSLADGLQRIEAERYDLLLLDLNLPDCLGLSSLDRVRAAAPDFPVVVLTSLGGEEIAEQAVNSGAQDFLCKNRLDPYWAPRLLDHALRRAQLARELEAAKAREAIAEQRANEARSAFLSYMSHEIRTPLSSLLMALKLVDWKDAEAMGAEVRRIVDRNGRHLESLINDFLDLAKLETGHLGVERESTDIATVVDSAVAIVDALCQGSNAQILTAFDPRAPKWILSDSTRMTQVVANLLSNAIKYGCGSDVHLRVEPRSDPAQVAIVVTDHGRGMSPDDQERLFQPFVQVGSQYKRRNGTGLGLVLSRELARRLGGDVVLEKSVPNEGSTFLASFGWRGFGPSDRAEFSKV